MTKENIQNLFHTSTFKNICTCIMDYMGVLNNKLMGKFKHPIMT